jgi:hypothetical protein
MRACICLALALLATGPTHASADDRTPPLVRMVTPKRIAPHRFAVIEVRGAERATLHVNGSRVGGELRTDRRLRFRARAGWEPRKRYRIRVAATDAAGNVRHFGATIRARNFRIATVATRDLTRPGRTCGYVHLRPRHFRPGTAPLALGDSAMLGAAWRLTHAGFETDTLCGRSPRAGLATLRRRRHRGTLPQVAVVGLGTNATMTYADVAAMLRVLGPRRKLVLVTATRHWRSVSGAPMHRAARRHPRRVALVDWAGRAHSHPGWLWGDGTHLRPRGLPGYTRLIHAVAWSELRGRYVWRLPSTAR